MDNQRAKEIAFSPIMANVTYNGSNIYIDKVTENNSTASIHFLNQPEKNLDVPVSSLMEH